MYYVLYLSAKGVDRGNTKIILCEAIHRKSCQTIQYLKCQIKHKKKDRKPCFIRGNSYVRARIPVTERNSESYAFSFNQWPGKHGEQMDANLCYFRKNERAIFNNHHKNETNVWIDNYKRIKDRAVVEITSWEAIFGWVFLFLISIEAKAVYGRWVVRESHCHWQSCWQSHTN